jgi:hypothetical protein
MSWNENLFNLLSNFYNNYVGVIANSHVSEILVSNNNFSNWVPPTASFPGSITPQPAPNGYWVMTQNEISTSTLWSPVESIVFTSSSMPIVAEQQSNPTVFSGTNNSIINTVASNFGKVITDISIPLIKASDWRQMISYAPQAEYRMISFGTSQQPLDKIDIQVFYKNRLTNKLYPLRLTNYSNVNFKCMFRRII